jgi:hypothetical protein
LRTSDFSAGVVPGLALRRSMFALTHARSSSGRSAVGEGDLAQVLALLAELDLHRRAGREVGEDQHLVAGLHGVEGLGPHPGGAGDLDLEAAAGRADDAGGEQRRGQAGAHDDAVALESGHCQLLERDLVLDAAVDDRVDALHADLLELGGGGLELVALERAGGEDAVADDDHALVAGGVLLEVAQGAGQVGGAEGVALQDRLLGVGAEAAGLAREHRQDGLVEAEHAQVEVIAGRGPQLREDLAEAGDLALEVDRPRGAGVEQQGDAGDRLGGQLEVRGDAGDRQSLEAQADLGAAAAHRQLEVLLRHEVLLAQGQVLGARGARDDDVDVEVLQGRQAAQQQAVGLAVAGQGLRVGDDDLLDGAGGDREDAGAEAVAGVLLEQGGVLAAVQGVLVGAAGGLQLDDLGLLPVAVDLHGEARDGGAGRQADLEAALDLPVLRVLKHHVQLGERQRVGDHRPRAQRQQLEADALARGQREGGHDVAAVGRLAPLQLALAERGGCATLACDIGPGRGSRARHGEDADETECDGDGNSTGHDDSRLASVAEIEARAGARNAGLGRPVWTSSLRGRACTDLARPCKRWHARVVRGVRRAPGARGFARPGAASRCSPGSQCSRGSQHRPIRGVTFAASRSRRHVRGVTFAASRSRRHVRGITGCAGRRAPGARSAC